jgi:hypothetical protein
MKLIYPAILAGVALVGLAAFAPSLAGKQPTAHHLTIALPGGGTETISYTGDVVPKVSVNADPIEIVWPAPTAFGFQPSFTALDRLSFDMDRQMTAFMRQAEALARGQSSPDLSDAAMQTLPAGATYSLVSETIGDKTCTRTVQITQRIGHEKPEVVTRASGSCDAGTAQPLAPKSMSTPEAIAMHLTMPAPVAARTSL